MVIRILVTGSREWDDRARLDRELARAAVLFIGGDPPAASVVFVHGDARGADRMCREWVEKQHALGNHEVTHEAHPAQWDDHGKAAGPRRNQAMVDLGASLCLAFPLEGNGTWDCIRRANKAGIYVRIVPARGAKK